MADEIRAGKEDTYHVFKSLQYSLYVTLFVSLLGGGCFLMSSLFLVKDKKAADDVNRGRPVYSDRHHHYVVFCYKLVLMLSTYQSSYRCITIEHK